MRAVPPLILRKWTVAIVVAIFVVLGMVLLAFVVDRGRVYVARAQLQNLVDAAALAGGAVICTSGNAQLTALQYAELNDVDALEADGVTPTGVVEVTGPVPGDDDFSFLNVRTSQEVGFLFGGFTGVSRGAVAAQATTKRNCPQPSSDLLSDILTNFNRASAADNIYAGRCFEGSGGTYGLVAVFVGPEYNCWTGSANPTRPPIDFGTTGGGNPGTGTALYNQPPGGAPAVPYSRLAAEQAFPLIPPWTYCPGSPDCKDVSDFATSTHSNDSIICSNGGGKLVLSAPATVKHIVADDDIGDSGLVWGTAEAWDAAYGDEGDPEPPGSTIYSRTGDIAISGNFLPSNVTLFAPNGSVTFTGASARVDGQVYARNITLNGSGSDAATGNRLPIAGDVTLIQ